MFMAIVSIASCAAMYFMFFWTNEADLDARANRNMNRSSLGSQQYSTMSDRFNAKSRKADKKDKKKSKKSKRNALDDSDDEDSDMENGRATSRRETNANNGTFVPVNMGYMTPNYVSNPGFVPAGGQTQYLTVPTTTMQAAPHKQVVGTIPIGMADLDSPPPMFTTENGSRTIAPSGVRNGPNGERIYTVEI
jgi:hypothetical protein